MYYPATCVGAKLTCLLPPTSGGAAASKSEGAQPDAQQPQPQQQKQSAPEAELQDIAAKIGGQPSQQARPQPSGRQDPVCLWPFPFHPD